MRRPMASPLVVGNKLDQAFFARPARSRRKPASCTICGRRIPPAPSHANAIPGGGCSPSNNACITGFLLLTMAPKRPNSTSGAKPDIRWEAGINRSSAERAVLGKTKNRATVSSKIAVPDNAVSRRRTPADSGRARLHDCAAAHGAADFRARERGQRRGPEMAAKESETSDWWRVRMPPGSRETR